MKPKAHILIVEDKAILYKRLSMALKQENYSVDGFTPSVSKALERIQAKMPDVALLDIDLEGEKSGIDLGKILAFDYKIPFIYVTDYDDNETFFESLQTEHENFLVKTKPRLDTKQVIRAIQTALHRKKKKEASSFKDGLLCFADYIGQTKDFNSTQVSQIPIPFEEIVLITTNSTEKNEQKSQERGKPCYHKLKTNYTRVENWKQNSFYLPISLAEIIGKLPHNFIRINESEIVNLSHHVLEGRINGSRLKIGDYICHISKTYKPEVEKRLELLYQKFK
ncbi:response regulator transcription factor [Aequorivita viscosa]|uniref:Response regulator receiver domain-containing protein n=1 Tax=Aequorivita viscosa TaxID=797419 RepID=A0A1M6LQ52_9FLAO|nr:response regulator [Aequorivita viscosa]SDX26780.1 Response regulator receiver domain-containing protein [Aequorivita viscosa]SHJ73192.1 Response regulator receiver domain-containing protein [Aequorivita viscosa]